MHDARLKTVRARRAVVPAMLHGVRTARCAGPHGCVAQMKKGEAIGFALRIHAVKCNGYCPAIILSTWPRP